jgi:hypothetical protein
MRVRSAHFANFICHFGDKVLLNYVEEIVFPAFLNRDLVRTFGETRYLVLAPRVVVLDPKANPPITAITGRFVKDTVLRREQVLSQNELFQNRQALRSAPSAFFVLLLNNHHLIYFPETAHAPPLSAFRATIEQFLRKAYHSFVSRTYESQAGSQNASTKKDIYAQHASPMLDIVPLTSAEDIETFLNRYETLKKIEFRIFRPNDDLNAGEMFAQIHEFSIKVNSANTKVVSSNSEGLDTKVAKKVIAAATSSGNEEVNLSGTDTDGNKLTGNNEHFQLSVALDNAPKQRTALTKLLFEQYEEAVKDVRTINANLTSSARTILRGLFDKFNQ